MYMNNMDFMKPNTEFACQRVAVPLYYADSVNHCPSCGRSHWHIGRSSAECAFCNDAIPLARSGLPSMTALLPMDAPLNA